MPHERDDSDDSNYSDDSDGSNYGDDSDSSAAVSPLPSHSVSYQSIGEEDYVEIPDVVTIHSIDADGCFLPDFGKNCSRYFTMAEYNRWFFSDLLKRAEEVYGRTIILSGSARQGSLRDLTAMLQQNELGHCFMTDSYFFALQQFVNDINARIKNENWVELDHFLLDDICFDRPSGDTFKEALEYGLEWFNIIQCALNPEKKLTSSFNEAIFKEKIEEIKQRMAASVKRAMEEQKKARLALGFFWETSHHFPVCEHPGKFALLYAQIHHIASQFSINTPLFFHFYDDRLDILGPLVAVFIHASELLPKNMTLYFHHYLRGMQQRGLRNNAPIVKEVKGTGVVDLGYRETVRAMFSKVAVSNMPTGGVELPLRIGNPLDYFFEIVSQSNVDSHQSIVPAVTIHPRETFVEFNEDRLIRMGVKEEQSFSGFFEEMRRRFSAMENDIPKEKRVKKIGL